MPYIEQQYRKELDPTIDQLIELLKDTPVDRLDGELNYTVTRLLKALYPPKYYNYNRMMGVLSCIQLEAYRRFVAPYEDTKIIANGPV